MMMSEDEHAALTVTATVAQKTIIRKSRRPHLPVDTDQNRST
jgi:hypothetical protein